MPVRPPVRLSQVLYCATYTTRVVIFINHLIWFVVPFLGEKRTIDILGQRTIDSGGFCGLLWTSVDFCGICWPYELQALQAVGLAGCGLCGLLVLRPAGLGDRTANFSQLCKNIYKLVE